MSSSWEDVVTTLQELIEDTKTKSDVPLFTYGVVRDFLIKYLDLEMFNGLDGDLLALFSELDGRRREELSLQAYLIAMEQVREQVRKGNTFFLDATTMADVPELVPVVADILDSRNGQILSLEKSPPLRDVYSTYYGFTILTQGSIDHQGSGVSDDAISQFSLIASQIGRDLKLQHRKLKYSKDVFGRVSEYTQKLLWNLLRLSVGGDNIQAKALRELGNIRDSRALPLLNLKLQSSPRTHMTSRIIKAIARVGHSESIDIINEMPQTGYRIGLLAKDAKIETQRYFNKPLNPKNPYASRMKYLR